MAISTQTLFPVHVPRTARTACTLELNDSVLSGPCTVRLDVEPPDAWAAVSPSRLDQLWVSPPLLCSMQTVDKEASELTRGTSNPQ